MIDVNNISKSYSKKVAVDGLSFQLSKGDIVGFLGSNGAGKSTTMKILAGTLNPDNGNVSVFGHDIINDSMNAKRRIGYLPEDNPLYGNMYVREYLEYISDIYSVSNKKDAISKIIENTGLQNEYRKKISTLSKGNRQRVGLAQALIHDPDFLILDEPTTGLDPNQQVEIRDMLANLGSEKIIFFSSHILQEVTSICNRYIIIDNGKIIYDEKAKNTESIEDTFHLLTRKKQ
ncbi:MAG: ABC transporter ATP-binding protein [Dysgonomonas sp.]